MKRLRMDNGSVKDAKSCPDCGKPGAPAPNGKYACHNCHTRWSV